MERPFSSRSQAIEQDLRHRARRDLLRALAGTPDRLRHHRRRRGAPPIIDILPSRNYADVAGWIDKQPGSWKERIHFRRPRHVGHLCRGLHRHACPKRPRWSTPSTSSPGQSLPRRHPPAGPGRTARSSGPARRPALSGPTAAPLGEEKLSDEATERLGSLLDLGDPGAEVAIAYRVKERLRDFYRCHVPTKPRRCSLELRDTARRRPCHPRSAARSHHQDWFAKIINFHLARVSNGPTEALNNLIKRIKRIGFGFRNFENYRIRALLYAGKPNWRVLGSIVVR